jgi:putative oxidoreductase
MGFLDRWQPQLLSVLRIVSGLLFLEHGMSKLLHFPHTAMSDEKLSPLILAAGTIELVGGVLLTLGLFSRYAAFIMSGEMAVAYFMVHVPKGGFFPILNGGDSPILFCFVFLYIAAAGPGPWSLNKK